MGCILSSALLDRGGFVRAQKKRTAATKKNQLKKNETEHENSNHTEQTEVSQNDVVLVYMHFQISFSLISIEDYIKCIPLKKDMFLK